MSNGQFCSIDFSDYSNSNINTIFESSIISNKNSESETGAGKIIQMFNGHQKVNCVNISDNRIQTVSGMLLQPCNNQIHIISYSNFYNNTALGNRCISFPNYEAENKKIERTNFILNRQIASDGNYGLIHFIGTSEFNLCSFIENDPGNGYLIYNSYQQTQISENCYFSNTNGEKICNENVNLPSKQIEEFTIELDIFITRFCDYLNIEEPDDESSISNDDDESSISNDDESSFSDDDESSFSNDVESSDSNDDDPNELNDGDLSGGEIAAISIACVIVVITIVGLFVYFLRKRSTATELPETTNA